MSDGKAPKRDLTNSGAWGDRGDPIEGRRRSTPEEALRAAREGRDRLRRADDQDLPLTDSAGPSRVH